MENSILKINHKVVQVWVNDVLKLNHTVVQGCVDVVRMYIRTHKAPNCNVNRLPNDGDGMWKAVTPYVVCDGLTV